MVTLEDCKYQGRLAHADGVARSACPYCREDRAAAWELGWLEHEREVRERAPLTDEEVRRGRQGIAGLRAALGKG